MTYRPPNFRTGRNVTNFEASLQVFLGIRARGGVFDKQAKQYGLEQVMDMFSGALTRVAAGGTDPRKPFQLDPKAFDEDSLLNVFLWQSRRVDPTDPTKTDMAISEDFQTVRLGVTTMEQGRERGDDAMVKWGSQQIRTGLEELKRKKKRLVDLGGTEVNVAEWDENPFQWSRSQLGTVVSAFKAMDITSAFDEVSPSRQADIIRRAAELPTFNENRLRQMVLRGIFSDSGNLRSGDPERLQRALQLTQDTLAKMPVGGIWARRRSLLNAYAQSLQVRFQRSLIQDGLRRVKNARQRQAAELLREVYSE
jgi:hypothetical protein